MSRNTLAAVAIAVLGLAIGLWLWLRPGDDEAPGPSARAGSPSDAPAGAPDPTTPTPTPTLPAAADGSGSDAVREYVVNGIRVRDHRTGSTAPFEIAPNIHRPQARELPSTLVHAISQQVQRVLADCARALPADAKGVKPRLEGQIVVGITDHKLAVSNATLVLRDVTGDAAESTRQCIEQKSVGLTTPAADQGDLADYSIGITFAVP